VSFEKTFFTMKSKPFLSWAGITAISLFTFSCRKDISSGIAGGKTTPRAVTSSFKVMGYLPSWSGSVSSIPFSKLTHINYAFLIPNSDGSLQSIDNSSKLSSMVSAGHAAGVKALISVGGGGGGGGFAGIVASSVNTTNFVNNMIAFCNQYGLDGVDIDWEYPSPGTQASNFLSMMTQFPAQHLRIGNAVSGVLAGPGVSRFRGRAGGTVLWA
jgi:GH18 family chitinase